MSELPQKVTLRVPATTANLGPAYDVLGMALSVFMEVTVEHAAAFSISFEGDGSGSIRTDAENLLVQTCQLAFRQCARREMPPLRFTVRSDIPFGCGCGSSSAAAVAGFAAGLRLCGLSMTTADAEELLQVIAALEGHPDNAAPALYGGIQLGYRTDGGRFLTQRVPTPPHLAVVLFVPAAPMKADTKTARRLVPPAVPLGDATFNIARAAMLVLALCTNDLRLLAPCADRLHEGPRAAALFPHFDACVRAARGAGAAHAFLSGAGPTVAAFVGGRRGEPLLQPPSERGAERVAEAMVAAAKAVGVSGRAIITQPSDTGVHFVGKKAIGPDCEYISI